MTSIAVFLDDFPDCQNRDENSCMSMAGEGFCTNPEYSGMMYDNCPKACGFCGSSPIPPPVQPEYQPPPPEYQPPPGTATQ